MIRNKKITQLFFTISNLKNKKWYSMAAWQQHNKSEVKAKKSTWFYRQCWAWVLFSQCCFFLSSFLSAFVSYLISLSFFHIFFFSSNNRVVFLKKKKMREPVWVTKPAYSLVQPEKQSGCSELMTCRMCWLEPVDPSTRQINWVQFLKLWFFS